MHPRLASSKSAAALFAFALTLLHGASFASPLYSGTIAGIFTDPILSGVSINSDGSTSALDNTLTAIFSGTGTNQLAWGACDITDCGDVPFQSVVTFTGASFVDMAPDAVFKLGTVSYLNGTSLSSTLIFGATLAVGVTGSLVAIDPALTQVSMLSTANAHVDAFADADSLRFDVFPPAFNVFEGATAVADVYGYIHGNPQEVVLGTLSLPPDQAGNGFLPEPGNRALLGLGLAMLALICRKPA